MREADGAPRMPGRQLIEEIARAHQQRLASPMQPAGRTLEEWIAREGLMGAAQAATIGIDVCRALEAFHREGRAHGDVRTSNIMQDAAGRIVLLEPGAGATLYLAAERILEGLPPTVASDLYSLGVVLYRLVSGRYPVEARTLEALRERHARRALTPLGRARRDLDDSGFARVVERALDPDPGRRFSGAIAMEQALWETLGVLPRRGAG